MTNLTEVLYPVCPAVSCCVLPCIRLTPSTGGKLLTRRLRRNWVLSCVLYYCVPAGPAECQRHLCPAARASNRWILLDPRLEAALLQIAPCICTCAFLSRQHFGLMYSAQCKVSKSLIHIFHLKIWQCVNQKNLSANQCRYTAASTDWWVSGEPGAMSSKERDKLQALTHLSSIRVVYANQIHLCFVLLKNKDNKLKTYGDMHF